MALGWESRDQTNGQMDISLASWYRYNSSRLPIIFVIYWYGTEPSTSAGRTRYLQRSCGVERCMPAGSMFISSFVRVSVRPYVPPSRSERCANKFLWSRSFNFCTHARWQGTFACQLSSKSSIFLTLIFKVRGSNRNRWQVHNAFESSGIQANMLYSVLCSIFVIGTAALDTEPKDDINRHDASGCQESRRRYVKRC